MSHDMTWSIAIFTPLHAFNESVCAVFQLILAYCPSVLMLGFHGQRQTEKQKVLDASVDT